MMIQGCVVLGNHAAIKLRLHRPVSGGGEGTRRTALTNFLPHIMNKNTGRSGENFVTDPKWI